MQLNENAADFVTAGSFILTAVSLVIVAISGAFALRSNYLAKKLENDTKRLELWYKLMQNAVGMGDARRRSDDDTRWQTFVPSQIIGIQALSQFPEFSDIYVSIEKNFRARAAADPDDRNLDRTLHREWLEMMARLPKR
jgi:hypothetical protein